MKHKLLPLMIAGLSASTVSGFTAAEAPTLYGKIDVSLQTIKEDQAGVITEDKWEMNSNASRIGVKGSHELSEGLKAIYKAEFEIFVDDGQNSDKDDTFKQRNIYVGLQGKLGTIIAGKHDTPTKLASKSVDLFNDLKLGDIKNVMSGENREDNIVIYTPPKFGKLSVSIAAMPGEDDESVTTNQRNGAADGTSIAISYKTDAFNAALAADNDVQHTDTVRLVGDVKFANVKLGALYQMAEESNSGEGVKLSAMLDDISQSLDDMITNGHKIEEQTAYLLSAQATFDKIVIKAQYSYSESEFINTTLDDMEVTQTAVGVDYKLSEKAKLYSYYSMIDGESSLSDYEYDTLSFGFQLKF